MKPSVYSFCLIASMSCWVGLAPTGRSQDTDARKEFLEYKAKAENGDPSAQSSLGYCYAKGEGVEKNPVEAVKWYRKAADQNDTFAQAALGSSYTKGEGIEKDLVEAVKWYRKAADQNNAFAQVNLGVRYAKGEGVKQDFVEAVKWYRRAADQNNAVAQCNLGYSYHKGEGIEKDYAEAVKWYRKAADQNSAAAQGGLSECYYFGDGVERHYTEAYAWSNLAARTNEDAGKNRDRLEKRMSPEQIADGQKRTKELRAMIEAKQRATAQGDIAGSDEIASARPMTSGTGFFITDDGYLITNQHVVGDRTAVRLFTADGSIAAKLIKVDKANDLVLLKTEGKFTALAIITSRAVRLGATIATVGFPNVGLQGFAPKLAKGEIASLAGAQDDARHFQISAPIQPGNSGGALVDENGCVVGVVVAKLSQKAALATSGTLAENVNYAVKSSYLLSFLESVPEVAAKLKEPNPKTRKFEDVVKNVEQATVLVVVY